MKRGRPGYNDVKSIIYSGFDGNGILAEGTTVPTDGTTGYAPGCWFFKRAGGAGTRVYWNDGSITSCAFKAMALTGTELALLSGLLATAAEINRNNKASTRVVNATGALGVSQASHDGKTILLNNVVGFASTLPVMSGSGSRFRFVVGATVTTPSHTITATAAHLVGSIFMVTDTTAGTMFTTDSVSANATPITTITLNGTTTGGRVGDWVEVEDVASGIGVVRGMVSGSGTEATPFS